MQHLVDNNRNNNNNIKCLKNTIAGKQVNVTIKTPNSKQSKKGSKGCIGAVFCSRVAFTTDSEAVFSVCYFLRYLYFVIIMTKIF